MSIYRSLMNDLTEGKKVVIVTSITKQSDGRSVIEKCYYTEETIQNLESDGKLSEPIRQAVSQALEQGELIVLQDKARIEEQQINIIEPYFPQPKLIVLGAGHIAKPLVEFAAKVGFAVTVVDDRLSFANRQRFPDAEKVICESFERCFDLLSFNPYTYVVVVTRGHRHDLHCLRSVVQRTWAYAGMIGSRKRVKGIKDQLLAEGYPKEILDKVNAPIGLEIGAVTPVEIAISILGQLIAYRRLQEPSLGRASAKISWTEFDRDVIEELCQDKQDQKALVTVISAKGSVPRRAGAKMLVWPDGRILGSIGGGCSEGLIIQKALDIITTGGHLIHRIDLTGSVAEDEGMVCGGNMKVLIESI